MSDDFVRRMFEVGAAVLSPNAAWNPPEIEEVRRMLPDYDVQGLVGRGGMGAVYKGTQKRLDRVVAIKVLSPGMGAIHAASFAERFKNEARAMARLSHPGIVAVHDFGEAVNGMLYIVMEYVEGTDLAAIIPREGRLHTAQALALAAHICDALHYAHERGIVHRDIKPSNILINHAGVVKVADFGLAKITHAADAAGLTIIEMAMGTLHYMAPEMLTPDAGVDRRADVYALGVMLCHMLTGVPPHGFIELPSLQVPGLDPRLDGIIAKAMRGDRERRYQTAAEMRTEIDSILTQPNGSTPPSETLPGNGNLRLVRRAPPRRLFPMLVITAFALTGTGAWLYLKSAAPAPTHAADRLAIDKAAAGGSFSNSLGMKFAAVSGVDGLLCIHETRRRDWAAFAAANPRADDKWRSLPHDIPISAEGDHPVVYVSYSDVADFCAWLGAKEGLKYRLPTDREWSFAVGIGSREAEYGGPQSLNQRIQREYPWGAQWPPPNGVANLAGSDPAEHIPGLNPIPGFSDGFITTAPVMSFPPNSAGLFDLGGNVWEMCEDWYDPPRTLRTTRGGSWTDQGVGTLLSSGRGRALPAARQSGVGFRLIVEIPD